MYQPLCIWSWDSFQHSICKGNSRQKQTKLQPNVLIWFSLLAKKTGKSELTSQNGIQQTFIFSILSDHILKCNSLFQCCTCYVWSQNIIHQSSHTVGRCYFLVFMKSHREKEEYLRKQITKSHKNIIKIKEITSESKGNILFWLLLNSISLCANYVLRKYVGNVLYIQVLFWCVLTFIPIYFDSNCTPFEQCFFHSSLLQATVR